MPRLFISILLWLLTSPLAARDYPKSSKLSLPPVNTLGRPSD